MSSRLHPLLLAAGLALALAGARADETTETIKFSDPNKPGKVNINLGRGEIHVTGADTTEVTIKSDAKAVTAKPRKDGLRVISSSSGFSLTEKDNVVTVEAPPHDWGRGSADFRLTVPRNTSLIVQNAWGGEISCAGITGDIEINSMQGAIRLDDVRGGVVVGTMSGDVQASIRELHEGKPLSFTSMNGEVLLRVAEDVKANLRFRTHNGSVLTDFPEGALVTKAEAAPGGPRGFYVSKPKGKVLTSEIEDALREASRISATAVKEALQAVKDGLEASRLDDDDARRQLEEAKRNMERARRESDRARRDSERERRVATARAGQEGETPATPPAPAALPAEAAKPAAPAAPAPKPMPGMMAMPGKLATISGGKLVTGALNGGGPEINVSTMNGDVTLRKLEKK